MSWGIRVSKRALRDLAALNVEDRNAIEAALRRLANNPSQADLRKLQGGRGWRLRVGNWRVIVDLDNAGGTITVGRVLNRRDAYRG
jgi:mRNA interferase RelE/StbE